MSHLPRLGEYTFEQIFNKNDIQILIKSFGQTF